MIRPLTTPYKDRVTVIGAGGHIGLPLSAVLADAGCEVVGVDINEELNATLSKGIVPYVEHGLEELLKRNLADGRLRFTSAHDSVAVSDVLVLIIGTPVDDNLNPRIDPLLTFFREHASSIPRHQLIVLRSTVSPGTTELVKRLIEDRTGLRAEEDFYLVFAPERVLQTRAVEEIQSLPQLVGAFGDAGYARAAAFFGRINRRECLRLEPVEAELGKLITNMSRYVTFALANEFYMICDSYGANAHKVIRACNLDYPRLDLPRPGPNVGGPCLYKDGYYLTDRIPYPELVGNAFKINESVPSYLVQKIRQRTDLRRAGILGMTFKPDCDDIRNSLSFKLQKRLRCIYCEPVAVDPYVQEYADPSRLKGVDALFLMTPHKEFRDLESLLPVIDNPDCVIVDMWNFWREYECLSHDGVYTIRQIQQLQQRLMRTAESAGTR